MTPTRQLRKILGLGFGLAIVFGTMVGVGILRLPGTVAAAIGDPALIIACWCVGGLYTLMGAVSLAELAAMFPEAGGFRVYARRAFGERAGFVVGWIDWLAGVATLAYAAVTVVAFLGTLWAPVAQYASPASIAVLAIFAAMHWVGLRIGSSITSMISATIGILMLTLVVACFLSHAVAHSAEPGAATLAPRPLFSTAILLATMPAFRAILTAYDGWYAPIYLAEESVDAARTLPRAIIGGALVVFALYLLINIAFLRVLPLPVLSASELPAAAAAQIVLPRGGAAFISVTSVLTVFSLINSNAMTTPRVLFAMAREGWISPSVAAVSRGGTPRVALAATMSASAAMIITASFNQIIALFAVLILLYYISAFLAVLVLRYRIPGASRPYHAFGYPFSTSIVLLGSVGLLITSVLDDWRSGIAAVLFLSMCIPAYKWAVRSRRARFPDAHAPIEDCRRQPDHTRS